MLEVIFSGNFQKVFRTMIPLPLCSIDSFRICRYVSLKKKTEVYLQCKVLDAFTILKLFRYKNLIIWNSCNLYIGFTSAAFLFTWLVLKCEKFVGYCRRRGLLHPVGAGALFLWRLSTIWSGLQQIIFLTLNRNYYL